MAERTVFLVDPDTTLSDQIASVLQTYGLTVLRFADGNEALAQPQAPSLIVLCIDPKRLGWAVCNRMKKSAGLKGVPLVVTSAEASEKDFEDHKNLKNRAEEYLRKPFSIEALVDKIGPLIGGLEEPVLEEGDLGLAGEELAIEESIEVDPGSFDDEFSDSTGVITGGDFVGQLESELEAAGSVPGASDLDPQPPPSTPPSEPPPDGGGGPGIDASGPIDLGLDAVAAQVTESSRVEKLPGAEGEVLRLRAERDRLKVELEEARARRSEGGSFSREREFLNLREVINKKEKEVLDLKDAVDAKDRQLLDAKDRLRESERARRDQDEKMLAVEKDLVAAREKVEALVRDKETQGGREKGLKSRLDDALKKLERANGEIDEWRAKHAADVDAAMAAAANAAAEAEAERGQREAAQAAVEQARARFEGQLAEAERGHGEALAAAQAEGTARVAEAERRGAEALEATKRAHEKALADLNDTTAQALLDRDQAHADEIAALRAKQAEVMAAADQRAQEMVKRGEERHRQDLLTADRMRTEELAKQAEEHERAVAELRAQAAADRQEALEAAASRQAAELSELMESHSVEKERLTGDLAGAVDRSASLDGELTRARGRIAELEAAAADAGARAAELADGLAGARGEVDLRDQRLAEHASRIAELEGETAKLQEQVLQAYQKLRSDETIVARARKALAIALTLLDEGSSEERKSS